MSTGRINFYIAREIAVPTALALLIFTFILLMGRILKLMELVINKGVPLADIGRLFIYLLPSFLVLTIPLSLLLGVMLGFGRLSADSEMVAMKASGVSLYGMVRPVFALALIACLITGSLTVLAGPAGNRAFRQQIFEMASTRAHIGIQARVFNDEFDDLVLYANDADERRGTFDGVMISDERTGEIPAVIFARHGRVFSDQDSMTITLRLEDGAIHRGSPKQNSYQIAKFATYNVNLNMGQQLEQAGRPRLKPADLDFSDISKKLADVNLPLDGRRKLMVEFHKRFTFPLAPLILALIGVPLGIQSHRSGRGGGFSLALLLFLAYYLSLTLAETLVVEADFPPLLSLWTPNLLFLAAGAIFFHQTANEKRYAFFDWALTRLYGSRRGRP